MVRIFKSTKNIERMDVQFSSKDNFYDIKSIVSSCVGSYYDRANRMWKVNIDDADELLEALSNIGNEIVQIDLDIFKLRKVYVEKRDDLLKLRNKLEGVDCGVELVEPHKLLPFQHVGAEFLYQVQNGIVADKVGLGKTIQSFSAAYKSINKGKAAKCFVIVPNSLKRKWHNDIKKFLGIDSAIIEGTQIKRQQIYEKWMGNCVEFGIISYDTLRIDWGRYISNNMVHKFGMIVDEVQYIKNPTAKRSEVCKELAAHRLCAFRFGLSATYVETGLENIFGVMLIVDDNIFGRSYSRFVERYINVDYFGKVVGYNNIEEVTRKMKYVAVRRHKEQVKDQLGKFLPTVSYNTLWVELTPQQKKLYNEVLVRVTENIEQMEKAEKISMATALSELIYLRQVCVHTDLIGANLGSSAKTDILKEMLPSIVEENKVVIFSHFVGYVDILENVLKDMGINCIAMHGKRSEGLSKNRQDNVDRFSDSPNIPVLITSDILKEGIDLPAASHLINVDILWNPASMVQRAGRIDRLNQKSKNLFVTNIWGEGSIEEQMWSVVYQREELANQVMDDGYVESRIKKLSFKDIKKMLRRIR